MAQNIDKIDKTCPYKAWTAAMAVPRFYRCTGTSISCTDTWKIQCIGTCFTCIGTLMETLKIFKNFPLTPEFDENYIEHSPRY